MADGVESATHLAAVQSLLSGRDKTTLDKKGRMMLPKTVRDAVGVNFVLLIGRKGCLEVTSNQYYNELWAEINRYSKHSEYRRDYALEVMGNAFPGVEAEESGRFVVPQAIGDECKLTRGEAVVVIGAGDVAEIWSESEYAVYQRDPKGYNRERRDRIAELYKGMLAEGPVA
ncbi:MAG: hypothetical protein JNM28_11535 [Armatimonadetes bacterium]|nr:hypothetical protein [Armatimonadota bacterium]MBS1712072.1 hypothetical protein [Armatimonadota bacterium]MBX3109374.1 hypothetical protein [Fimbriimonadaceae bacterium]